MSSPFQKAFSAKSPLGYVSIQPAIASAYKSAQSHIADLKTAKNNKEYPEYSEDEDSADEELQKDLEGKIFSKPPSDSDTIAIDDINVIEESDLEFD